MMARTDEERAWTLLESYVKEYRPFWLKSMKNHAQVVMDVATFIGERLGADMATLRLGAILHDIGRSQAQRTVEHGVESGEVIRKEGFPEAVARMAETHVGVGISKEEARGLGLGDRDLTPKTLEERILCYSDNLLFYRSQEGYHEIRDTDAVVERFTKEMGEGYGGRTRRFMDSIEKELGEEAMAGLRDYIQKYNAKLKADGR